MKYLLVITFIFSFFSCVQENKTSDKKIKKELKLTDKSVKFLWRANKFDKELKDTINTICINEEYCKTISDPEKAVLGYIATFIGNECEWDGDYTEDRSNLKCRINSSLKLGYQCSEKHLSFLKKWFKKDTKILEELKNCPTTPFTASSQETFDEINLVTKNNTIKVLFKVNGVNMQIQESWNYTVEKIFKLQNNNLTLIKVIESKIERESFKTDDELEKE